ncbi:anthocyanidin 3-O-glucosyltransferase 2-like [Senna tora]|uniref:Anthocyanidin 3-O-glucosyltransferase 2-like n=1 Tax=Senna tora TaxID=362788 RepID=A0A834TBS1_9FABA|nr:anthocyanidin 3-O-glucosyltransferase 2-like [Senna tora]
MNNEDVVLEGVYGMVVLMCVDCGLPEHKEGVLIRVKQAVSDLIRDSDSSPLAGIIVDMFCIAMIDIADEFGISIGDGVLHIKRCNSRLDSSYSNASRTRQHRFDDV